MICATVLSEGGEFVELISCTPYIRFANYLSFEHQRGPSRTYDCRFLYTMKGTAVLRMAGKTYRMQRGSLSIFPPNTEYVILPESSFTLAIFDFDYTQDYNFTTDYLIPCGEEEFRLEKAHRVPTFSDVPALNSPFHRENLRFLEPEIAGIITEFAQKRLYFRGKISAQFKNMLFDLARYLQAGDVRNEVVERIVSYIDSHPIGRITNTQIGTDLNYNPNYLNRLMLQHTGMSLHQYILQRRLTVAAGLLQTTHRPISDIAIELGFNSLSHFSNYFKKETGATPLEYRRSGTL